MAEDLPHLENGKATSAQALIVRALEHVQGDFEVQLRESNQSLQSKIEKVAQNMNSLREGMERMKAFVEYIHRQNPAGKKKLEEFEEHFKKKDEEIQRLKKELVECSKEQNERLQQLDNVKTQVAKKLGITKLLDNNGIGVSNDGASGSGKKFEFHEEVTGENVIVGAHVAAISDGGPLQFAKPLESNDLLNPDAQMESGSRGNPSGPVDVNVTGALVGNDNVNIQQNIQRVFIAGPNERNIAYNEDETIMYNQASQDQLADYLEMARQEAERSEGQALQPHERLTPGEELQDRNVVVRVSELIKRDGSVEHFIRLCSLLNNFSPRQLRSLASDLCHIIRIDLTNIQIDYDLLSAFFRCFKLKRFQWLLFKSTRILAADMGKLGNALGDCKIGYLDLGNCAFEYLAFFKLASVLIHVESVILRGITSATIIPENGVGEARPFSADDAQHLAESISSRGRTIEVDLSCSDLLNVDVVAALSNCMGVVSSLRLHYSKLNEETMSAFLARAHKLQKLDLTCAQLRNSGVKGLVPHLAKAKTFILCNVLLEDEGVQPLVDALEELPEKSMDVFDISSNPISAENVTKFLKVAGKAQIMIFSKEQIISYENHSGDVAEQILLSEVTEGRIVRLEENAEADNFTHWVACTQPVDDKQKGMLYRATQFSHQDTEARVLRNYRCSKCKAHIAFMNDAIQPPCENLLNDRRLWGALENPFFSAVTHAVSCEIVQSSKVRISKRHSCGNPKCPISRFKMRGCKCTVCKQNLGGFYSNDSNQGFWCLYQEVRNSQYVGSSGNCRTM